MAPEKRAGERLEFEPAKRVMMIDRQPLDWRSGVQKKLSKLQARDVRNSIGQIKPETWQTCEAIALLAFKATPEFVVYQIQIQHRLLDRLDGLAQYLPKSNSELKSFEQVLQVKMLRKAAANMDEIIENNPDFVTKREAYILKYCILNYIIVRDNEGLAKHFQEPVVAFKEILDVLKQDPSPVSQQDPSPVSQQDPSPVSQQDPSPVSQPESAASQVPRALTCSSTPISPSLPSMSQILASSKSIAEANVKEFLVDLSAISETFPDWDKLQGLDDIKAELEAEAGASTQDLQSLSPTFQLKSGNQNEGTLLFGPGGVGKTSLAMAFAYKFGLPFYCISSDVKDRWVGSTEANIKALFELLTRQSAVLLVDEAEGLLQPTSTQGTSTTDSQNQSIASIFKLGFNKVFACEKPVWVFAATNRPERISLTDYGRRFQRKVFVGPPGRGPRADLIESLLRPHTVTSQQRRRLAAASYDLTADEITRAVFKFKKAVNKHNLGRDLSMPECPKVAALEKILFQVTRQLTKAVLKPYEVYNAEHGTRDIGEATDRLEDITSAERDEALRRSA